MYHNFCGSPVDKTLEVVIAGLLSLKAFYFVRKEVPSTFSFVRKEVPSLCYSVLVTSCSWA